MFTLGRAEVGSETAYYLSANPELLELARTRAQGPPVPWGGQL